MNPKTATQYRCGTCQITSPYCPPKSICPTCHGIVVEQVSTAIDTGHPLIKRVVESETK